MHILRDYLRFLKKLDTWRHAANATWNTAEWQWATDPSVPAFSVTGMGEACGRFVATRNPSVYKRTGKHRNSSTYELRRGRWRALVNDETVATAEGDTEDAPWQHARWRDDHDDETTVGAEAGWTKWKHNEGASAKHPRDINPTWTTDEPRPQWSAVLLGVAGTGKSFVLSAITMFTNLLVGIPAATCILAPSGVAAAWVPRSWPWCKRRFSPPKIAIRFGWMFMTIS